MKTKPYLRMPPRAITSKFPGYCRNNFYRMSFLSIILFATVLFSNAFGQLRPAQKKPRNIILVIADDLGAEQIRSYAMELDYSSEFYPADLPNIHLLEKAGIRFTQAWSNPSCSPTRAGIFTGQYSSTHGIYSPDDVNAGDSLEPYQKPTVYVPLPLSMAGSGYKKALFGKWHLGYGINPTVTDHDYDLPREDGFDYYAGSYEGQLDSYMQWEKIINGSAPVTRLTHATFDLVNDAKNWISARSIDKTAFFAVLAFNAPHSTGTGSTHEWKTLDLSPHCTDVKKFGTTSTDTVIYKAQLHCLDAALGELITFMKVKHPVVLDNTIIIFIGDNGTDATVGEGPVVTGSAKGSLYQGGVHIPFIVADGYYLTNPQYRRTTPATSVGRITKPGTTCDRLIHTRDIYGTVRELAAIPDPDLGTESHSLVKFMSNPLAPGEQYVITEGQDSCQYAIRNYHYKLIHKKDVVSGTVTETFFKIDKYKWDETDLLPASGLSGDALTAYKKLKAELVLLSCYCK